MIDREFNKRLADYFDADQLTDLLEIDTEDLIAAFPELIRDRQEELEEYMLNGK